MLTLIFEINFYLEINLEINFYFSDDFKAVQSFDLLPQIAKIGIFSGNQKLFA